MKAKKLGIISIALAIIVPSLVMATVVISYNFPTSTTGVNPDIYLTEGSNYAAANALGLVYAKGASSSSGISSGTTVYINTTSGSSQTALVNIFVIVNNTPANNGPVYVTLFAPSTIGVTMYASTSALTVSNSSSGITISGTQVVQVSTSGSTFHLTSPGDALYIGFLLTGTASGSSTLVINYQIS